MAATTQLCDKWTEYIVFGYIRNIQSTITENIIPLSIIELCVKFYVSVSSQPGRLCYDIAAKVSV